MFLGSSDWWMIVWFGICQIGIAAGMVFWSHYWRRHENVYPAFAYHGGHFLYFLLAWAFSSAGVTLVWGGILYALRGGPVPDQMIMVVKVSIIIGLILTVVSMSLRLVKSAR